MTVVEVRNLTKEYMVKHGLFAKSHSVVRAVDGVSFSIEEGETLGLVGESGCGKTTTGRCILRLIEPTSGEIHFQGKDLLKLNQSNLRPVRRHMQMIFQDPYASLNHRMTIGSIIEEPLIIHKIGNKCERTVRVAELLKMVGLDPLYMKRYPHEFSGGQRQRIGIARALALNPRLIVADEPVSALDVSVQAQIINLLKDLQQEMHLTFLFIAHDLSIVHYFSDRVGVMYLGKITELAASRALFRNPLHPYTKILLSSIPVADPAVKKKREQLKVDLLPVSNMAGCKFQPRCPVAIDRCKTEEPELKEVEPGHFVSCHLV